MLAWMAAVAWAGCEVRPGHEVRPGIPAVDASCHWPDLAPSDVVATLGRVGHHDDLFWMIDEEHVVHTDGERALVRQRVVVPPLRPRDATLWVTRRDDGATFDLSWELTEGPVAHDAVPVAADSGWWRVTADPAGGARVDLHLAYDPGGAVPAFLVRWCQGAGALRALGELHDAATAAVAAR